MRTVVALGGHLLAHEALDPALLEPLGSGGLVFTHGNGPQVGERPDEPLHRAVARTQAELGSGLALALGATCVLTHVAVDPADTAFAEPTKPVGAWLDEPPPGAAIHDRERGWRRVVASPQPLEIVELAAVRTLSEAGVPIVCCGGGGIPVADGRPLEAVIDKDRVSALLAERLQADRLVVLTDVDALYLDFGTPAERALARVTPDEAEGLLPDLPAGSMQPKLEACAEFVRATRNGALVTSARALGAALEARAGTWIATP